uniref:C-type lectin domain-containing protein n=1 Tax=Cacopsylla melanoneura TaxID=428564 RepID=A0A8D9E4V1_9HEMI
MEIDSNMSQGDSVCTQQNGRLLYLSSPSSQDIAVNLMIRARQKPQYVWTGGGEPWDWKTDSSESRISNFFPSHQDYGGLDNRFCSVLEITGQWLKVPCDQGNYMSLCEVPAFYTLVKQYPLPPSTISYPTVSFPSYDTLTTPTYPSPYDGNLPDSNYPSYGPSVPTSPTYFSGYYPPWINANPQGYVPFYSSPVPPHPTYVYPQYVPYLPGQYPSYPIPPATYGPPITSPPVSYGPPLTSPPATYGIPAPPPTFAPTVTAPPATYGPPMTPPPAQGPPIPSPPLTYSPPIPPATYRPPATYGPPVTAPPATYGPPITSPPATYVPPATVPQTPYRPVFTPPPIYPTYSTPTPPPPYQTPPPFPPSFKPPEPPPPTYGTFPFYKDGKPHYHFVVPQTPSYGYPGHPQGTKSPYPTTPDIYYHQAPRPPVFYQPLPRPNCGPSYQPPGYDCQATSPPLAISTFPPGINPYFPPLVIYQPGYQNYSPTPHYKGYVPPAAHPTNIPYKPFTDFPERSPFQGRTYIVKGDMAYEIPTLHKYHRWDRDNIHSGRSVEQVNDLNGGVDTSNNNTAEQFKNNPANAVPKHKHINETTFYYSKNNYLSNANSLPRDALFIAHQKDKNGNDIADSNFRNLGNSTKTNTTVINKNSTFSTNVEYTKELNAPSKVTIEIQRDGVLSKIVLPNDTKRNNNNTAVITPVHPG